MELTAVTVGMRKFHAHLLHDLFAQYRLLSTRCKFHKIKTT